MRIRLQNLNYWFDWRLRDNKGVYMENLRRVSQLKQ